MYSISRIKVHLYISEVYFHKITGNLSRERFQVIHKCMLSYLKFLMHRVLEYSVMWETFRTLTFCLTQHKKNKSDKNLSLLRRSFAMLNFAINWFIKGFFRFPWYLLVYARELGRKRSGFPESSVDTMKTKFTIFVLPAINGCLSVLCCFCNSFVPK